MIGEASVRKPIAQILHQCRRAFAFAFLLTLIIDLLSIAPLLYMLNIYDRVIPTRSGITLVSLTILIIGLCIFWSSLEWLRSRLMVRLSMRLDWDLAIDVFDASFRRNLEHRNANIHQLMGDLLSLRQFMTGAPILALMDAPFVLVFITIGFVFHPYLAIFAIVASCLMLIATYATQKISSPILQASNQANAEALRIAANGLRQAETTLALGMMHSIRDHWYQHYKKFLSLHVNASEAAGLTTGVSNFLTRALPSMQIALGAWLAIENVITGGMVIAASMLISKSIAPIQKLISNWKEIVTTRQAYHNLNLLLEQNMKQKEQMPLPAPLGYIEAMSATAIPPGYKKPVITGINFKISPGQALAIVGPSASGKTCLIRLLAGIWKPADGSVRLDGVELAEWDHTEVGQHIGYVPQEIDFFEGSIAQNIARLGTVDADKVIQAAKLIGIHEMILGLPDGYDTQLGDSGYVLSGGQKQRLAIARAFYGQPRYLVFDEPNANLDEIGETALVQALAYLKNKGVTIIFTTHRTRLLQLSDYLLVLRAGNQVGYGLTDAMMNKLKNALTPNLAKNDSSQSTDTVL